MAHLGVLDALDQHGGGYWDLLYNYRSGQFDTKLRKYMHDWKLEQLALPCFTVSADLVSGQAVVRNRGDAVHAVLESINLPMLSAPDLPQRTGADRRRVNE